MNSGLSFAEKKTEDQKSNETVFLSFAMITFSPIYLHTVLVPVSSPNRTLSLKLNPSKILYVDDYLTL
jgi:hypothetical protein